MCFLQTLATLVVVFLVHTDAQGSNAPPMPGAPQLTLLESSFTYFWDPPHGSTYPVQGYNVNLTVNDNVDISEVPATPTTYTKSGVPYCSSLEVQIQALYQIGPSLYTPLVKGDLQSPKPDPPTSLQVVNVAPNKQAVKWTAPENVPPLCKLSYRIYRLDESGTTKDFRVGDVGPHLMENLLQNNKYRYHVSTVIGKDERESDPSKEVALTTTSSGPPFCPESIVATAKTEGIEVQWKEPRYTDFPPTGYLVTYSYTSGHIANAIVGASVMKTLLTSVQACLVYNITVYSKNDKGNCIFPTSVKGSRLPAKPTVPANFKAQPLKKKLGATISWDAVSKPAASCNVSYMVHMETEGKATYIHTTSKAGPTEFTSSIGNINETYYVRAVVNPGNVESDISPKKTVTLLPNAVTSLVLTSTADAIAASWKLGNNANALPLVYRVEYKTKDVIKSINTSEFSVRLHGLQNCTTYTVNVTATSAAGHSPYHVINSTFLPPKKPTDLTVQNVEDRNAQVVTWTAPYAAGGCPGILYEMDQRFPNGSSQIVAFPIAGSHVVENLVFLETYTYAVQSVTKPVRGESGYTASKSLKCAGNRVGVVSNAVIFVCLLVGYHVLHTHK